VGTRLFFEHESVFNHYAASHRHGDVLQTTHWGKLKGTTGWDYYPLAVEDNGAIQASALILARKLPLPGQTLFYSPRGPLFSSLEALRKLLSAGRELGHEKKAILWKMDPPLPAGDSIWQDCCVEHKLIPIDTGLNFEGVQPRFIMDLDISKPLDALLEEMKSKTRYNIRYAERKGVQIVRSIRKSELGVFYALLQETAQRDKFTIRPLIYFESLWDHLVENKLAQLFLAYHNDTPLAASIAFRLGDKTWYVYGASSNSNRNLQASHLIQWEMIRWAKGLGCKVYDFRGVSGDLNPDNPLYGLYRFKEGFGAQLSEYVGEYDLPLDTLRYPLWRKGLAFHNWLRAKRRS
jgi:peptidoglycan pentaglycine glycine transferase (the first glycine)